MKIFFIAPARGIKELKTEYQQIYKAIEQLGHDNVSDLAITTNPDEYYSLPIKDATIHYKKVMRFLREAEVVVIEASSPSLSMGYLVDKTLDLGKPVIILHIEGKLPFFLSAIEDEKVQILEYSLKTAKKVIKSAIDYAQGQMDTRFNFFISAKIGTYLDWMARKKKIPRAVYLRRLIEEDMTMNKEYNKN